MTIDITPEAVVRLRTSMRIGHSSVVDAEHMILAISSALTASQAETAAAYEAAAAMIETHVVETQFDGSRVVVPNPLAKEDQHHRSLAKAIRALTPADSKAALDRMIAEAEERGMRKAAALCVLVKDEACQFSLPQFSMGASKCRADILAAIPKGGE